MISTNTKVASTESRTLSSLIITNPIMFNGRSYTKDSNSNEKKLKALMEKLVIEEDSKIMESAQPKPQAQGGSIWRGQFRKQESKRAKTFKL